MALQIPFEVDPSGITPVLRSIVTKIVVAGGAALVTHGLASQDAVDADVAPVVQVVVGAVLALASGAYAAIKAKSTNNKLVAAVTSPANTVGTIKGS